MSVYIDPIACNGCQVCVDLCPTNALVVIESTCQISNILCIDCDACIDRCPVDAISYE